MECEHVGLLSNPSPQTTFYINGTQQNYVCNLKDSTKIINFFTLQPCIYLSWVIILILGIALSVISEPLSSPKHILLVQVC